MKSKPILKLGVLAMATIAGLSQAQPSSEPLSAASATSKSSTPSPEQLPRPFAPRYPTQPTYGDGATGTVDATKKAFVLKSGTVVVIDALMPVVAEKPVPTPKSNPKRLVVADANATLSTTQPSPAVLNLPMTETRVSNRVQPQSQEMPGLGVMPGTAADYQIKPVRVGTDRNERIYVALQQLNKIATPFETPQVVDTSGATVKAIGQDIFVQPANEKPLTIYISDEGRGQSIGVTLVPQPNLPAQSIVLVPDRPLVSGGAPASSTPEMVAPDYTGRLIALSKKLALGALPQGFTKSRLPRSIASNGKTVFEPLYKYSGSTYDIYSYSVQSVTPEPLELNEESFYAESVRAVSFYPRTLLQRDESTNVYIIVDREVVGANQ